MATRLSSPRGDVRQLTNAAEGKLRDPAALLWQIARELWSARYLAWEVMRRNVAGQYRQSLFGLFLAFLPPLIITAWCTLVSHAKVINVESLQLPYPAFVLLSMMLWMTFVEALNAPINGLEQELPSLSKAVFPAEAIVLAHTLEVGFHFGVKLVLIVGAILWFRLPVTWMAVFSPVALVLLIVLGVSIGMILAPINALYKDVGRSLGAITTFWLFLTPVLFPMPTEGLAAWICRLNPVTPLLASTREWATLGELSDPVGFGVTATLTLVLFLFSCLFFRVALPVVIDRTNA